MREQFDEILIIEGSDITLSSTSVDTQIDSLLVSFESDVTEEEEGFAIPEGASMRDLERVIFEADDDDSDDNITTDDEQKTKEPGDPLTPNVNVDQFAERVAMLIETYQTRLDIETVIFNRALNYIEKNHGSDAAKHLQGVLVDEHDIDLRDRSYDDDAVERTPPNAQGAGPSI